MFLAQITDVAAESGSSSGFYELLNRIPEEALAAVLILSLIFSFITVLVTVICLIEWRKSISLATINRELITDLLDRGCTPAEIEQIAYGSSIASKIRRLFKGSSNLVKCYKRPVRPVKHSNTV